MADEPSIGRGHAARAGDARVPTDVAEDRRWSPRKRPPSRASRAGRVAPLISGPGPG
jgi:hypothetical protein